MSGPQDLPLQQDWHQFNLVQIWRMLEPESRASGQIAADMWRRMQDLCDREADQIEWALERLAEHWPLTQPAAVAFQEWGAHLVGAMRGTAQAAAANGPAVDSITAHIGVCRGRILELMAQAQEYQGIAAQVGWHEANQTYLQRNSLPSPSGITWRQDLDRQAREIMSHLEATIGKYSSEIRADEPFRMPTSPREFPDRTSMPKPTAAQVEQGHDLPRWDDFDGDTMLDGGWLPLGAMPTAGSGAPGDGGSSFVDTPGGRVLAPGGVLGAPGVGASSGLGGSGLSGRSTGGVGTVPMVPTMMVGQPGAAGAAGGQASPRRARRGLPSVFRVPEAIPSVIQPPEELMHDPGPGVIGIDR